MKIKVINYQHNSKEIEVSDDIRGVQVEVVTGDEIVTCIGDGEILDVIDSADVFNNPRLQGFPDGSYAVKRGTPDWDAWMKRPNDSYAFLYGDWYNDEAGD